MEVVESKGVTVDNPQSCDVGREKIANSMYMASL